MNWVKRKLRQWLQHPDDSIAFAAPEGPKTVADGANTMRINVNKVIGGYVIMVESYKPNRHGPDWTGETMIVPDGKDLMDAIKTLITMKMVS